MPRVTWRCKCKFLSPARRFGGTIENGLLIHPDGRTLIYPLGSTIVLRDKNDPRAQEFLQGHSDKVREALLDHSVTKASLACGRR
jgi:hypothetical protein